MKLIPYICCGDPDREFTLELINILAPYSYMIELGIPFSDPICDGKTIQNASTCALKNGMNMHIAFGMAKRAKGRAKLIIMTYYNLIHHFGVKGFFKSARKSGIEAVIIPDLPFREDKKLETIAQEEGIKIIGMIAPNTDLKRAKMILQSSSPFTYLVSASSTTGARSHVTEESTSFVRRIRALAGNKELFVGFGISARKHADKYAQSGADGVIIGSKIIDIYNKHITNGRDMALRKVQSFAKTFK